jgi:hypothetical protein
MAFSDKNRWGGGREIGRVGDDFNCGKSRRLHLIAPEGLPIPGDQGFVEEFSLSQDWGWAAIIIAIPFILFGAFELAGMMRRRRFEAIARRSKEVRRSSSGSRRSRTG